MYEATLKSVGFDEVRARYRQVRRQNLREIILKKISKTALQKYLESANRKLVKKEDLAAFLEDVEEDLREIDKSRLVGLGVTWKEVKAWKRVFSQG
jgi:hypothetical protein